MDAKAIINEQELSWGMRTAITHDSSDVLRQVSALATQHSALLFRVAFSVLRNTGDAEDVVQETFLRVWKHQRKLAEIENFRVWLVRIAWNLALDRKRRLRSMPLLEGAEEIMLQHPSAEASAENSLDASQGCVRILRMMEKLPRKEREVLRLSAMEELGTAEIAAVLQTTESSVRSCLFRARQRLRKRLEKQERRRQP